jgi:hypothetical protein
MTTDNFCFHLQNRQIQTSQTGGQWYSDTSPLVFPGTGHMFVFPWLLGIRRRLKLVLKWSL